MIEIVVDPFVAQSMLAEPEVEREVEVVSEDALAAGWMTVKEYRMTPSGVAQPVVRRLFVGWFGRTAPRFVIPVNSENK